jgi:hypothetical protein
MKLTEDDERVTLFPEGIRVESKGPYHTRVVDIATGKEVQYVASLSIDIDANQRPFNQVTLTIDVPRIEYTGPVTVSDIRSWTTDGEKYRITVEERA